MFIPFEYKTITLEIEGLSMMMTTRSTRGNCQAQEMRKRCSRLQFFQGECISVEAIGSAERVLGSTDGGGYE